MPAPLVGANVPPIHRPLVEDDADPAAFFAIVKFPNLSNDIASKVQVTIAQGVANNLSKSEIKGLMAGVVGGSRPDAVITTMLATYEQSVIATMAEDLPDNTEWEYIGPRDEKNRPVCREYLNRSPLTKNEITSIKSDGFIFRGGWRCRHQWNVVSK